MYNLNTLFCCSIIDILLILRKKNLKLCILFVFSNLSMNFLVSIQGHISFLAQCCSVQYISVVMAGKQVELGYA